MKLLVFGNIHQAPFVNNLLLMIRGLEQIAEVRLVEPFQIDGFFSTGGARAALIPSSAVEQVAADFKPDAVFCLAGGLYLDQLGKLGLDYTPLREGVTKTVREFGDRPNR